MREAIRGDVGRNAPRLRSHLLLAVLDGLVIAAGYGAIGLTYRGTATWAEVGRYLPSFLVVALVVHLLALRTFHLYGPMWNHAGMREVRRVLLSSTVVAALLTGLHVAARTARLGRVPLNVIFVGGLLSAMGVGVLRFRHRLCVPYRRPGRSGVRVAVVGSRDAGAAAVRDMLNHPQAGLIPVAVFDDESGAHGRSLLGVPVVGPVSAIAEARAHYRFDQVLLAIPSPSRVLMHDVLLAAEVAGVTMRLLPGMRDMAGGTGARPLPRPGSFAVEDLLGRRPITIDLEAVRHSLRSSRVLITGAGGSIGSEISRQVADYGPELVILLDRDETHLDQVGSLVGGDHIQALVDIRDPDAVSDVFTSHRPTIVFHAAAHKHVPILESHPIEAVRTNVFGTLNLVEAAAAHGVPHFVLISTDKAVRPTSVMGAAKLVGERILLAQPSSPTTFSSVRFGNVLGSRGSVIPTFARQIASGGPVTVTDPLMTRFFMTVEEAVQLVLQASLLASGGDIFMLDMGEPVSILDLARRMIRLSGYGVGTDIEIQFVGGRPGEKLTEELCSWDEEKAPTSHSSIHRLSPPAVHPDLLAKGLLQLHEAITLRHSDRVRQLLFGLAQPAEWPVDTHSLLSV
jgi:FlaA1/EpsC-like NDP-sugar epimerase